MPYADANAEAGAGYRFEDFQLGDLERERGRNASIAREIWSRRGRGFNEFLNGGRADGLYSPYVLFLGIIGAQCT